MYFPYTYNANVIHLQSVSIFHNIQGETIESFTGLLSHHKLLSVADIQSRRQDRSVLTHEASLDGIDIPVTLTETVVDNTHDGRRRYVLIDAHE